MPDLRPIPRQPGYLCGADGSIWSLKSGVLKQMRTFARDKYGHYGVNLTHGGKYRMHSVHVLVALTWIGPRPSLLHIVMHRDDNPARNNSANLEWGLPADNSAQMVARNRQARGERAGNSKLTSSAVAEIRRRLAKGQKQCDIAAAFGISATNVTDIKLGRIWRADA